MRLLALLAILLLSAAVSAQPCVYVEGYHGCGYFARAEALAQRLQNEGKIKQFIQGFERSIYKQRLAGLRDLIPGSAGHETSPIVWEGCSPAEYKYIGGSDKFTEWAAKL